MEKRPMFERSHETKMCVDILLGAGPGDTIDWSIFEETLGQSKEQIRGYIDSARRILLSEHDMVFDTVRGVGVKRLENHDIPKLGDRSTERIRREANCGIKKLGCVEYKQLAPEERLTHNANMTVLRVISSMSKPNTRKQIRGAVADVNDQLPVGRALAVLGVVVDET